MTNHYSIAALLLFALSAPAFADTFGGGANTFDIEFITIGNPGNVADTTGSPNPAGSVPYVYRIGKFETSESMIEIANALGGLAIAKDTRGPNKPVTSVSWNECARFVNWLNSSTGSPPAYKFAYQPGEVGYDSNANIQLWAISDAGYNPNNLYRNSLARYFLPSEDEWYKAAYYDPTSSVYYDYPTGSDSAPISVSGGTSAGTAVYAQSLLDDPADVTNAGGLSPYGTMAQAGNAEELEESAIFIGLQHALMPRVLRGSYWRRSDVIRMESDFRSSIDPVADFSGIGFRVASSDVPEPSTTSLVAFGLSVLLFRHRKSVPHNRV